MRGGSSYPKQLSLGNRNFSDGFEITQAFNCFFGSVFADPAPCYNIQVPGDDSSDTIYSVEITESLVLKHLKALNPSKGPGCDGIPPILLINCAKNLAEPVSLLFKRSLKEGIFPDQWKVAHVVPVHKSGSKINIEKYRPISILNILSKIFEKIVY